MRVRYELILWYNAFLKNIPGNLGCAIRNLLLPYLNGKNVKIWDNVHIDCPSKLEIDDNVSINRGTILNAGGKIKISKNVLIGPNCVIYSQNHRFDDRFKPINEQGYSYASVFIAENVWIASNVIILPGVSIGKNSIIAAGAIVTKDVEENSLMAGNPAKLVRTLI